MPYRSVASRTGENSIYSGAIQALTTNSNVSPSDVWARKRVSGPWVWFEANSMPDQAEFQRRAFAMSESTAQTSSREALITRETDVEGIVTCIRRRSHARRASRSSPRLRIPLRQAILAARTQNTASRRSLVQLATSDSSPQRWLFWNR